MGKMNLLKVMIELSQILSDDRNPLETDNCRLIIIIAIQVFHFQFLTRFQVMRVLSLSAGEGREECFAREHFFISRGL